MIKNETILSAIYMIQDYSKGSHFLEETVDRVLTELKLLDKELEALQQSKSCECLEDVIFVWNETSNFIESIVLNTEDLALDVSKSYKVCIVEAKGTMR